MLAERWLDRLHPIVRGMYSTLAEQIPVVQADADLASVTLASCASNVETILTMLRSGTAASATEAPATALEHARLMATRGAEINDTLRFYRLGHGYFLGRIAEELRTAIADPERVLAAMQYTTAFTTEYVDVVSGRVSAEHLAERERRQRRVAVIQADLVASLLTHDPADLAAAERTLGHRFDAAQVCVVCWSTRPTAQLELAATAIAAALGSSRPLLVPDGPEAIVAWLTPSPASGQLSGPVADALAASAPDVCASIGRVGVGLAGFRATRDEAERARRVAKLLGAASRRCVAYDDIALLDVLTTDLAAARRFVHRELGDLAAQESDTAALRETLAMVLAPRGGIAHAARLQELHRNTVLHRTRRAEALRGRSLSERPDECSVALLLALALPDALDRGEAGRVGPNPDTYEGV